MPDDLPRTPRGFRLFAERLRPPEESLYGQTPRSVTVVESSLAFRGAHVRIYEGPAASVQLNVTEARLVRDALAAFVTEAEAGDLTEPVRPLTEPTFNRGTMDT